VGSRHSVLPEEPEEESPPALRCAMKRLDLAGGPVVSRYNPSYVCTVSGASETHDATKLTRTITLDFKVVGDGSLGPLQDPMLSTLSCASWASNPSDHNYTTHDPAKVIAGSLTFKDVPASGQVMFSFGAGGYAPVQVPLQGLTRGVIVALLRRAVQASESENLSHGVRLALQGHHCDALLHTTGAIDTLRAGGLELHSCEEDRTLLIFKPGDPQTLAVSANATLTEIKRRPGQILDVDLAEGIGFRVGLTIDQAS